MFKKVFPKTKWIYLDRETKTLTKSLMHSTGGFIDWWDHPVDALRKHFLPPEQQTANKEDYLIQMIQEHRNAALNNQDDFSLLMDYPMFLEQYENNLDHFDLVTSEDEKRALKSALKFDSKIKEDQLWEKPAHWIDSNKIVQNSLS